MNTSRCVSTHKEDLQSPAYTTAVYDYWVDVLLYSIASIWIFLAWANKDWAPRPPVHRARSVLLYRPRFLHFCRVYGYHHRQTETAWTSCESDAGFIFSQYRFYLLLVLHHWFSDFYWLSYSLLLLQVLCTPAVVIGYGGIGLPQTKLSVSNSTNSVLVP